MESTSALRIAIELVHVPSQVRFVKSKPLPDGVPLLLRIAAKEEDAINTAVEVTGRSHEIIHEAATFFIEQILLDPKSDSYRVLGAGRKAANNELRHNMALLLRWLHPDINRKPEQTAFVCRVTGAWEDLKSSNRRAAYNAAHRTLRSTGFALRNHKHKHKQARSDSRGVSKRRSVSINNTRKHRHNQLVKIYRIKHTGFLYRTLSFLFGKKRS